MPRDESLSELMSDSKKFAKAVFTIPLVTLERAYRFTRVFETVEPEPRPPLLLTQVYLKEMSPKKKKFNYQAVRGILFSS